MCSFFAPYLAADLCLGGGFISCARLSELALSFFRGFEAPPDLFLFSRGFCRRGITCELNLFDADIGAWCGGLSSCIGFLAFLHLCTFVVGFELRIACGGYSQIFFLIPLLFVFVLLLRYLYGFL